MKTKDKVKELLQKLPELRDNDNRLCCYIWYNEIQDMNIAPMKMSSTTFFKLYSRGKFTPAPSIKRARAKLQEENPEYRGEKYYLRTGKYRKDWRNITGLNENNKQT